MNTKTLKSLPAVLALAIALLGFGLANPGSAGAWLADGVHYQYPNEGGTWQYGFWNARVRSYYNVNQCHGSTVRYDGSEHRSVNTAAGATSIAHLYAYQHRTGQDAYFYRTC